MSTPVQEPATSVLTIPSDREVHIERVFDAPRELVWRAFTEPELLAQWWGRGNKLDIERMEVERDGMLNSGMQKSLDQSYAALDRLLAKLS